MPDETIAIAKIAHFNPGAKLVIAYKGCTAPWSITYTLPGPAV